MKFVFDHSLCYDFSRFEANRLPARSFFIPYSDRDKALKTPLYEGLQKSDRIMLLDGEWDFAYFKSFRAVADIDTANYKFDKISVPSMWQYTGYDHPWYLNTRYEFPVRPPHLPMDFSFAVYRKLIDIEDTKSRYIITFLGVAGGLALYVNGRFAGYGEGSHNSQEFDISPLLIKGENEIVAAVYRWTNGTYIEAQDMLRASGIFRSVYITKAGLSQIYDFEINDNDSAAGREVEIRIDAKDANSISAELFDAGGNAVASGQIKNGKILLTVKDALLWSAERPYLYKLLLANKPEGGSEEYIAVRVGFRTVSIDGDVLKFNGRAIKLLGVNHHDTNPKTGYYMSFDDMKRDVTLMKELNVNCVRTSHYPPHPFFMELCSEYGIYVVDEADIEAHGCYNGPHLLSHRISNRREWIPRYRDRVERLYQRDKNSPAVIMWSLGNESGWGLCHDACYEMLKTLTNIPVHYEGAVHGKRIGYDVNSMMYPHPDLVKKIGEKQKLKFTGKPYYLCEYAHAMGTGPGSLADYVELFLTYDNILGGCIWEWADHAVSDWRGLEFAYGGDFGEPYHDGNFCVDGLVSPMRKPHPGAYLMKACYRPVRARRENGVIYLKNIRRFTDTSDIKVICEVERDGKVIKSSEVKEIIQPMSEIPLAVKVPEGLSGNVHVRLLYKRAAGGGEIAREEITVSEAPLTAGVTPARGRVTVEDGTGNILVSAGEVRYVFDKKTGVISSVVKDGEEMLYVNGGAYGAGITENIWRAPNDNERNIRVRWERLGYDSFSFKNVTFFVEKTSVSVTKTAVHKGKRLFRFVTRYAFFEEGKVTVTASLIPLKKHLPSIPKFGLIIPAAEKYSHSEYYGLGEKENYPDFKAHTVTGKYSGTPVEEYMEPEIRPQDSGSHGEIRYLKVLDNKSGQGFVIESQGKFFSFNLSRYPLDNLTKAAHREDLRAAPATYIFVDGFVKGLGSNSCGPKPLPEYDLKPDKTLTYDFTLTIL